MRRFSLVIYLLLLVVGCGANEPAPAPTSTSGPPTPPPATATPEWVREGWELVWQDEFEGEEINRDNWTFDLGRGDGGWGNRELQWYTERPENVRIEDGILIIEAREEEFIRSDYTSARMKTEGRHTWTYGRFEASIQLPVGQGLWTAFWLLGAEGGIWPNNGEIDVMENLGQNPYTIGGVMHGPGYKAGNAVSSPYTLPDSSFADDFHSFALEWEAEEVRWYVDDTQFFTATPNTVPGEWVYDHPFFIILNLAVGGNYPGPPDETTSFPQQLLVDYVRVYQRPDGS